MTSEPHTADTEAADTTASDTLIIAFIIGDPTTSATTTQEAE